MKSPTIYFTVTNDLNYDQRMIRICQSLSENGFTVKLVGRKKNNSTPTLSMSYQQIRLNCIFNKGKFFYIEFNIRLFFFLLFKKMDGICAIDLDTILPCLWISHLKKVKRIYDAHELFCEMKEVVSRPQIYRFWKTIERYAVPQFKYAYTVNEIIANEFEKMYGSKFEEIKSVSVFDSKNFISQKDKYILYQGAVNEGRCFENLIPAMQFVDNNLIICGDGNFIQQAKELSKKYRLEHKIIFKGMLPPKELKEYTRKAYIGITLFENQSKSNYYSLANRFFDYIHSGTPQICVDYPVYSVLNKKYDIALLISDLNPQSIAKTINGLIQNTEQWTRLNQNCKIAAQDLKWQNEEKKLIAFYKSIFG